MTKNLIISCDWGTSCFRLCLVNVANYKVIAKITTPVGIGNLHRKFTDESADHSPVSKEKYYLRYLQKQIEILSIEYGDTLDDIPVITSGMASSSIGIKELRYTQLPFALDGKNIVTQWIPPSAICRNPVLMLSGVSSDTDVMRGEEIQLTGIQFLTSPDNSKETIYIFPGTHSKHIFVKQGKVQRFRTYMTGELFAILCKHSILKEAVADTEKKIMTKKQKKSFTEGVHVSGKSGLLNTLFSTRTNVLFGRFTKELNLYFLSGLLIGEELRTLQSLKKKIFLSASASLEVQYSLALKELGLSGSSVIIPAKIAEQAALVGQIEIYKNLPYRE